LITIDALLFPSGQTITPGSAGSHKGSPPITPAFGSSPNTVTGMIELVAPQFVPVNADNDNGSAVTNGIPARRDFSVSPIPAGDGDLMWAQLTCVGFPAGGQWSCLTQTPFGGHIDKWIDDKKTAEFFPYADANHPGGEGTCDFYFEGTHESSALNDVTITFTYTVNGTPHSASAQMTVTPLITTFTVTPWNAPAGQNVWFDQGNGRGGALNALNGMTTLSTVGQWGAQFNATLTDKNLSGNPVFIQNLTKVPNGTLGPTTFNNNEVGATFTAGTNPASQNYAITPAAQRAGAAFPLLDTPATPPEYPLVQSSNDGNTATIQAVDTPRLPPTANAGNGTAIDVQFGFKLYLVWKYPSGIYYPVAYYEWWVDWYATGNGPVNNIILTYGVQSDVIYIPSNATPGKMVGPVANANFSWQP
jgi:hypothetical protein